MNRRRRKLVRLDLQLKIVFITLFVASLVLLVNFQLTLASLWSLSEEFLQSNSVHSLLQSLEKSTLQKFLISVVLAVPLAASIGILYSFKFCGPLYRFKRYFTDLTTGRWDERCLLRKGDDLQDLCEEMNQCLDAFRQHVRRSHTTLAESDALLGRIGAHLGGADAEALQRVRRAIAAEAEEYGRRFVAEAEAAAVDAAGSAASPQAAAAQEPVETCTR